MTSAVLVLDASYRPLGVIPWEQAICLILEEKARLVVEYAGKVIRSANLTLPWPAVVALTRYIGRRRRVRFNRQNVLARDGYHCAYCGKKPTKADGTVELHDLTLDHVVPRSHARAHQVALPWNRRLVPVTCWENVVTCCVDCNARKADRTPEQARMTLRTIPRSPTQLDAVRICLARIQIPEEWKEWVPDDAAVWRDYWDAELEET
jgi:5-methylcytosine-specific restriction endonuclease McrA